MFTFLPQVVSHSTGSNVNNDVVKMEWAKGKQNEDIGLSKGINLLREPETRVANVVKSRKRKLGKKKMSFSSALFSVAYIQGHQKCPLVTKMNT